MRDVVSKNLNFLGDTLRMTSLILSVRTIPFMRSFIEFVSSIRSSITLIHIFNLIKEDS